MHRIKLACVIDDDPIYIFAIKRLFKRKNFTSNFIIYNNGNEAFKGIKERLKNGEQLPDIILLDINMPVMDGWQFLEDYKTLKIEKKIPIYVTSSSIKKSDVEKAQGDNFVRNYVNKPINKENLDFLIEDFKKVDL